MDVVKITEAEAAHLFRQTAKTGESVQLSIPYGHLLVTDENEWALAEIKRLRDTRTKERLMPKSNPVTTDRQPSCDTCHDDGFVWDMYCTGGAPADAKVFCPDCGGASAGDLWDG